MTDRLTDGRTHNYSIYRQHLTTFVGSVDGIGCNYVLHSSGQLFSHKRKHDRRLWDYGVPCKQPKLVTATATSASEAAADVVRIAASTSSGTTETSLCDAEPGVTQSTVAANKPTDGPAFSSTATTLSRLAVTSSSPSTQPSAVSKLTADSESEVARPPSGNDPTASSSIAADAWHTNKLEELPRYEPAASTAANSVPLPETKTTTVDLLAVRRSPDVNNFVPTTSSCPAHLPLPLTAVEQPPSRNLSDVTLARTKRPDDFKSEKLEKSEFVDLEILAELTKLKEIVDEKRTGSESAQPAQQTTNVGATSLKTTYAVASTSAISLMPTKSQTATKSSRSSNERKERDESWRKYLKRSAVLL